MTRIVGLDLSLTGTGIATLDNAVHIAPENGDHSRHITVDKITSRPPSTRKGDPPPSLPQRSARLRSLAGTITQRCVGADLVLVEGPSYGSNTAGTWDRAGLWWLIVGRLTGAGLNVVEVPPSNVKLYAVGKGAGAGTDKDAILAAVIRRYFGVVEVAGNNEADALVLLAMGARFVGRPIEPGGIIPAANLKALDKVRWTPDK